VSSQTVFPPPLRFGAWLVLLLTVGLGVGWLNRENPFAEGGATTDATPLPPLPTWETWWIGGEPLTLEDMRGEVWVLKVWTFDCVNCIRSLPYANRLAERYEGRARVLGIHAPEFRHERDPEALAAAIARHDLRFPTFVDQMLEYFTALDVPGWPTFYLVDRDLRIRGRWVGEVHEGTRRAEELEALLDELVAEPASRGAREVSPEPGEDD